MCNSWPRSGFTRRVACVKKLAAGFGLFMLDRMHNQKAATTSFFNLDQERVRSSTSYVMDRHQDMLAGMVIFSFGGLW